MTFGHWYSNRPIFEQAKQCGGQGEYGAGNWTGEFWSISSKWWNCWVCISRLCCFKVPSYCWFSWSSGWFSHEVCDLSGLQLYRLALWSGMPQRCWSLRASGALGKMESKNSETPNPVVYNIVCILLETRKIDQVWFILMLIRSD